MADDEPAPEFPYHIEVSPGVSALIHAEVPHSDDSDSSDDSDDFDEDRASHSSAHS